MVKVWISKHGVIYQRIEIRENSKGINHNLLNLSVPYSIFTRKIVRFGTWIDKIMSKIICYKIEKREFD